MNTVEHTARAERLLEASLGDDQTNDQVERHIARAQVHATLALVKATVSPGLALDAFNQAARRGQGGL